MLPLLQGDVPPPSKKITFCLFLRSLKAELEAARQKEEERLRKELQDELLKLQSQIHSEAEAEKAKIRCWFE